MSHSCESCGMPIETGRYCPHCVDSDGQLQDFEVRFERMVQWSLRKQPDLSRTIAEKRTLDYMASLPAWRNHPRVTARTAFAAED